LPSDLVAQRTLKYASLLGLSGALHLNLFDQPEENLIRQGSGALLKKIFLAP